MRPLVMITSRSRKLVKMRRLPRRQIKLAIANFEVGTVASFSADERERRLEPRDDEVPGDLEELGEGLAGELMKRKERGVHCGDAVNVTLHKKGIAQSITGSTVHP